MNKLAIFVEGQTEQLFIIWLIKKIASTKQVVIRKERAFGGRKRHDRKFETIEAESMSDDTKYFVLVVDCGTDSKVKSDILERYDSLSSEGYKKIIGVRDVYPDASFSQLSKLRNGLNAALPVGTPTISFILGVMEFETWILAEHTHFPKIHSEITVKRIKQELGIDVVHDDLSQRTCPSKDLSNIYWLEKRDYNKNRAIIDEILSALDYSHLSGAVSTKLSDLKTLNEELNLFFSADVG